MKHFIALALISATLFTACKKEEEDKNKKTGPAAQRCLLKEIISDGELFLKADYDPARRISKILMEGESYSLTYLSDGKIDKMMHDSSSEFTQYSYPTPDQIIREEVDVTGSVSTKTILTLTAGFVTKEEHFFNFSQDSFVLFRTTEITRDVFGNRLSEKSFDSDGDPDATTLYGNYDGKKNPLAALPYGLVEGFDSPQNFGSFTFKSDDGSIDEEQFFTHTYNEYGYSTGITLNGEQVEFILDCL